MRRSHAVHWAMALLWLAPAATSCAPATGDAPATAAAEEAVGLRLEDSVSLLTLRSRPVADNVLKLFSAAADPEANRVYVSGIMTEYVAVLDGDSEEWIDTIDSGLAAHGMKHQFVDPVRGWLYVLDRSNRRLARVDLATGEASAAVAIPANLGNGAVDSGRGRLYLSTPDRPGLRAYDGATLMEVAATDDMGQDTGPVIFDARADALWVLGVAGAGTERNIYRLDPETLTVEDIVHYAAAPGGRSGAFDHDPATGRFFIASARWVLVLDARGGQLATWPLPRDEALSDMVYDAGTDRVVVLLNELPEGNAVAGMGGIVRTFDAATGRPVAQLTFGKKPHRMTINPATGRIYVPNADASILWSFSAGGDGPKALPLGDSLEGIVVASDGRTVIMNSRLGGSYLLGYDTTTGSGAAFEAGTWPIPIAADTAGETLFVLNAWDSTLQLFTMADGSTPPRALGGPLALGLPPGSTDRLPDLAIDDVHKLAYAAYPEFARVAVVNYETGAVVATLEADGIEAGDTGGGPGQLQVEVNPSADRVFVFTGRPPVLTVYDSGADFRPVATVSLSDLDWSRLQGAAQHNLLTLDSRHGVLFLGPFELDGKTGQPTGRSLARGQYIVGIDPVRRLYWAAETRRGGVPREGLVAVDWDTLAEVAAFDMGAIAALARVYAVDAEHHRLYAGGQSTARLDIYSISPTPAPGRVIVLPAVPNAPLRPPAPLARGPATGAQGATPAL